MLLLEILDANDDVSELLNLVSQDDIEGMALQDEIKSVLAALRAAGCPTASKDAIDAWSSVGEK